MILIIDENRARRDTIAETFYYMGILSYALSPSGIERELTKKYKAVLIAEPSELTDPDGVLKKIRNIAGGIPIFSLTSTETPRDILRLIDREFKSGIYSSVLVSEMAEYSRKHDLLPVGSYLLMGLDACPDRNTVGYLGEPINLTKTEAMIVRYLIAVYPEPQSGAKILAHAYKQTKLPEDAAVRTQISLINRKFSKIKKERLIIRSDSGYVIATPELLERKKFT